MTTAAFPSGEVMVADPRYGTFKHLLLIGNTTAEGPWAFHHNGFGDYNFIHVNTGNLVPATAVSMAVR